MKYDDLSKKLVEVREYRAELLLRERDQLAARLGEQLELWAVWSLGIDPPEGREVRVLRPDELEELGEALELLRKQKVGVFLRFKAARFGETTWTEPGYDPERGDVLVELPRYLADAWPERGGWQGAVLRDPADIVAQESARFEREHNAGLLRNRVRAGLVHGDGLDKLCRAVGSRPRDEVLGTVRWWLSPEHRDELVAGLRYERPQTWRSVLENIEDMVAEEVEA